MSALGYARVDFDGIRNSEALRVATTGLGNDAARTVVVCLAAGVRGVENLGDGRPNARFFGWTSSLCCASCVSAALAVVKDLRRRRPDWSRQSA